MLHALTTLLALFPILNPFGAIPLFLSLTKGCSKEERLSIIFTECFCVLVLMLSFFLGGSAILNALQISTNAVRATGGLMLLKVGFQMNFPKSDGLSGAFGLKAGERPFLIPIAMPMLVGAGLITKLIEISAQTDLFAPNLLAIIMLTILSGIVLSLGGLVIKFLGNKGLDVLERLMGLLLIMMACEMLIGVARSILVASFLF